MIMMMMMMVGKQQQQQKRGHQRFQKAGLLLLFFIHLFIPFVSVKGLSFLFLSFSTSRHDYDDDDLFFLR